MTAPDSPGPGPLPAFVERHYRRHPVTASFTGVTEYDHQLPDWTRSGREDARAEIAVLKRAFGTVDRTSDDAPAVAALDVEDAELASSHFHRRNPCLYTGEAIFGVVSLMLRDHAPPDERAAAMISRLATVSGFLDAACIALDAPVPSVWIDRAMRECAAGRDLFLHGIDAWCVEHAVAPSLRADLNAVGAAAAVALAGFGGWVETCPRDDRVACGTELFSLVLDRAHWQTESAEALLKGMHEALSDAVAEWRAAAAPREWAAVQERLAGRHPAPDQYGERFQRIWDECRAVVEDRAVVSWPEFPIEFRPMPRWARAAAPALYFLFYRSPAVIDAPKSHRHWIPSIEGLTRREQEQALRMTNDWVIKSNHVVHHGGIGHHVQNGFARHAESPLGRIAGVDAATRLALPCAGTLVEGWACYATDLMAEQGFFTDDELVADKHARIRQIARGIVDIEVHTNTQSLSGATSFLMETTGMTEHAARREITRTTMFPGTGLIYWLGTTTLHEMRREFAARYGRDSLRPFHDRVLREGSVPVGFIRERLRAEG